jgi:hypothetical protein
VENTRHLRLIFCTIFVIIVVGFSSRHPHGFCCVRISAAVLLFVRFNAYHILNDEISFSLIICMKHYIHKNGLNMNWILLCVIFPHVLECLFLAT